MQRSILRISHAAVIIFKTRISTVTQNSILPTDYRHGAPIGSVVTSTPITLSRVRCPPTSLSLGRVMRARNLYRVRERSAFRFPLPALSPHSPAHTGCRNDCRETNWPVAGRSCTSSLPFDSSPAMLVVYTSVLVANLYRRTRRHKYALDTVGTSGVPSCNYMSPEQTVLWLVPRTRGLVLALWRRCQRVWCRLTDARTTPCFPFFFFAYTHGDICCYHHVQCGNNRFRSIAYYTGAYIVVLLFFYTLNCWVEGFYLIDKWLYLPWLN